MKIHPEFKTLLPSHDPAALLESIRKYGVLEPLTTWRGYLVDGHHRWQCIQTLGCEYRTVELDLPDVEAVKAWIFAHQTCRRNLTPDQIVCLALRHDLPVPEYLHGSMRLKKARDLSLEDLDRVIQGKTTVLVVWKRSRPAPAPQPEPAPAPQPEPKPAPQPKPVSAPTWKDLRKHLPCTLEELCDRLRLPPAAVRQLVAEAATAGYNVEISENCIGPKRPQTEAKPVAPVIGHVRIAVASDLHAGSKFTLISEFQDFVQHAYHLGCREVVIPGDLVDGCYEHGRWELTHHGAGEQAQALYELLPRLEGLRYIAITGNHDETFTETSGQRISHVLESWFRAPPRGFDSRDDLHIVGERAVTLDLHGARIDLWHPAGSQAYAKSYKLQKRIEAYSVGHKPQITLVGHYHQWCQIEDRGIFAMTCPTFQGPGSRFSKSLPGGPCNGGLILEWTHTETGMIRDISVTLRRYFAREWTAAEGDFT